MPRLSGQAVDLILPGSYLFYHSPFAAGFVARLNYSPAQFQYIGAMSAASPAYHSKPVAQPTLSRRVKKTWLKIFFSLSDLFYLIRIPRVKESRASV